MQEKENGSYEKRSEAGGGLETRGGIYNTEVRNWKSFVPSRVVLSLLFLAAGSVCAAQTDSVFVAVTPCRVVDTRNPNGALGGPIMTAGSTRSFPLTTSACSIPSTAAAYSLNVTVVPTSGLSYLTIWPTGQTQPYVSTLNSNDGLVVANAAVVPAGTSGAVSVYVTDSTHVILDINGYFTAQTDGTSGSTKFGIGALASDSGSGSNTGVGTNSLNANTTGYNNSAVGFAALKDNTTGVANTAFGQSAMAANTTGNFNTGIGSAALYSNTTGSDNTAVGQDAGLYNVSGGDNTAIGMHALLNGQGSFNTSVGSYSLVNTTSGGNNTALGYEAGYSIQGGNGTTAIGYQAGYQSNGFNNIFLGTGAGYNVGVSESYDIEIGNQGLSADSGVIRIGDPNNQSATFIAGIANQTMLPSTLPVVIDTVTGQLGIGGSSIKFKEDVRDIGEDDRALMQLRPVSFRYKGTTPVQYGLIAEEVEKVYPNLVVRDRDGQPLSVEYQELPALLLKEIQTQRKTIETLEGRLSQLEKSLDKK